MVTDTGGLLVGAEGHPADIQDRDGRCGSSRRSTNCFPGWATCSPTASTTAPSCVMPSSNLVTGPSRSSNAPLMRPAFNCCRAAGWSNKPWPAQAKPTSGKGCRGIDCQRQSVGLCRLGTASSLEDWCNHCITYLSYSTAIPIQIQTLSHDDRWFRSTARRSFLASSQRSASEPLMRDGPDPPHRAGRRAHRLFNLSRPDRSYRADERPDCCPQPHRQQRYCSQRCCSA